MSESQPPELSDQDRLDALSRTLDEKRDQAAALAREDSNATGAGIRYASEFAGTVIAGAGLGWIVDRVFGVSPWGLLIGMGLGFAAGVRSVVAMAKKGMTSDDDLR